MQENCYRHVISTIATHIDATNHLLTELEHS